MTECTHTHTNNKQGNKLPKEMSFRDLFYYSSLDQVYHLVVKYCASPIAP